MSEETMDLTPQLTLTPDAAAAAPQAPSLTLEPNADQQQAQAAQQAAQAQREANAVKVDESMLTEAEKIKLCELVTESGADYIKTSTGFSTGGATREDVALFKAHIGPGVKIKAAGGISSLQDAEDFMALGADRLGTSRIVKLVKGEHAEGY